MSWRPGDSRFTSSAISCNISRAEMSLFQDESFFKCNFYCQCIGAKGENIFIFFHPLVLLFVVSSCSLFEFPLPRLLSSSFPVQCPAHEVRFDSTGVILSPGFPENYPNLQMCSWLISVEKGYNITLYFELFQTEKEFDILEIFDGGSFAFY